MERFQRTIRILILAEAEADLEADILTLIRRALHKYHHRYHRGLGNVPARLAPPGWEPVVVWMTNYQN